MYQTDKCVVAQVLKMVVIINLIIIDHSRMIQAFRIIEISKYDDGGQLATRGQLMQGSSSALLVVVDQFTPGYQFTPTLNFLEDLLFFIEKMFATS